MSAIAFLPAYPFDFSNGAARDGIRKSQSLCDPVEHSVLRSLSEHGPFDPMSAERTDVGLHFESAATGAAFPARVSIGFGGSFPELFAAIATELLPVRVLRTTILALHSRFRTVNRSRWLKSFPWSPRIPPRHKTGTEVSIPIRGPFSCREGRLCPLQRCRPPQVSTSIEKTPRTDRRSLRTRHSRW